MVATSMSGPIELALGMLIWCVMLWDGFVSVVLPRTVDSRRRPSALFIRSSWRLWAWVGPWIPQPGLRLSFLAFFGPLMVMLTLALWGGLMIVAFSMIYHGLGPRFQSASGPAGFGTLLYMSGSTFLTLGLGDVTSSDPVGRLFTLLEAASGYVFLALIITYMPLLDQAYASREVGSLLIHSRAGSPPGAIQLLSRYAGTDHSDLLRSNLREAERWMAETLLSHLSHPVLSFYRAHHVGQSWLVALATVLDSCALLIADDESLLAAQARLTYDIGVRLLEDLAEALGIAVDPRCSSRLAEADLPALIASAQASRPGLILRPERETELLRLVRRYDGHLVTLAAWFVVPLPSLMTPTVSSRKARSTEDSDGLDV
jgi:hypothetical protein